MLNYIKILWVNCEECEAFLATVSVSQLCAKNIIKNKKIKSKLQQKFQQFQSVSKSVRQSVSQSIRQTNENSGKICNQQEMQSAKSILIKHKYT